MRSARAEARSPPGLNWPAAYQLRPETSMDLGARVPDRCVGGVTAAARQRRAARPREGGRSPTTSQAAARPGPPGRGGAVPAREVPLKNSREQGAPRRRCLDFLLLIGALRLRV